MCLPQVILVRHGQTDHNLAGIMQGLLDVPLNPTGERQAALVAGWLSCRHRFDRIYASPLQRAYQTAAAIADRQTCPLVSRSELRELDVGAWQGLSYEAARAADPELWSALQQDPLRVRRPGGESIADAYQRVIGWWRQEIEPLAVTSCCIVTHAVPVRAILAHALDVDMIDFGLRMVLDNTSVSVLEYDQPHRRWRVRTINQTCHLDSETC